MGLRELITLRTNNLLAKHHRRLDHIGAILSGGTMQLLNTSGNQLNRMLEKISSGAQKISLTENQRLNELKKNIPILSERFFERHQHRLEILAERVKNLSPENVLKRGYAMVLKDDQLLVSAKQIEKGDGLKIVMHDGEISSEVVDVKYGA